MFGQVSRKFFKLSRIKQKLFRNVSISVNRIYFSSQTKKHILAAIYGKQDFPGGPVVKNVPADAGDTGSIPGTGRFHMPQSNRASVPQPLKSMRREPSQERPPPQEVHVLPKG